jgi:hypothetical protein
MTWRPMLAAVLMTLTLGCDRPDRTPITVVTPSGVTTLTEPTTVIAPGLSIVIVTGGSVLTTTVFPASPLRVPRGSTLTCLDGKNTPQPGRIAGTVNSGIITLSGGSSVLLPNAGTFTLGCALQPGITVTIIVV